MAVVEEVLEREFLGGLTEFYRGFRILRNIRQEDNDKGQCEDGHSGVHQGEGVGDAGVDDGRDEEASEDDDGGAAERVEGAAELDELVAAVAAAA